MKILERKSKFISKFENKYSSIICPSFYILAWAHRCSFEPKCAYCFLNLTLRYENEPIIYSNTDDLISEVKDWLEDTQEPSVLNTGELADSFMIEDNQALADLMDIFEAQDKHKLLFLSKCDKLPIQIEDRIYSRVYKNIIFSFSISSLEVANLYERGAPSPYKRLALAYRLKKHMQQVRVRIDPIICIKDYKSEYEGLINVLNNFLQPERITLGSLRFFKRLPNFAQDKDVFKHAIDNNDQDRRMRLPLEKRAEIYKYLIDNLECSEIALCKETLDCHRALNSRKDFKCNCML